MTTDSPNPYEVFMFQIDLLTYSLRAAGLKWTFPRPSECRRFFQPFQGDVIMRYRNGWDEQFRKRIRQYRTKELLHPVGITVYIEGYARDCFGKQSVGNIPSCFFVFSAFVVDLTIFCCRYEKPDLIDRILFGVLNTLECYLVKLQEKEFWLGFQQVVKEQNSLTGKEQRKRKI